PRILVGCRGEPDRLHERLHVLLTPLVIQVPPLRERPGDLPILVGRVLNRLDPSPPAPVPSGEKAHKRVTDLTEAAWQVLKEYSWPGNLREFSAVLTRAWQRCDSERVDVVHLPRWLRLRHAVAEISGATKPRTLPLAQLLEAVERRLLTFALNESGGN